MRNPQDHQELLKKVTLYLDNELSREDEHHLLQEIKSNPAFYELLSKERSFREFIKSKVHRRKISPAVVESIKEKIRIAPV
jgi:hypothetical protein